MFVDCCSLSTVCGVLWLGGCCSLFLACCVLLNDCCVLCVVRKVSFVVVIDVCRLLFVV